jgi:hypothetical protein
MPDTGGVSKFMFGGLAGSASVRVFNPVVTFASIAVLLLFSTAALGGVLDPTSGADEPDWWPGVGFVVLPVVLAVRGVLIGVVVTDSEVLLRGWLRTRRLPRDRVLAVTTKKYSGLWNRGSQSRLFRLLAIKTPKGVVDVPAVAARLEKAERLASTLRGALSVPE